VHGLDRRDEALLQIAADLIDIGGLPIARPRRARQDDASEPAALQAILVVHRRLMYQIRPRALGLGAAVAENDQVPASQDGTGRGRSDRAPAPGPRRPPADRARCARSAMARARLRRAARRHAPPRPVAPPSPRASPPTRDARRTRRRRPGLTTPAAQQSDSFDE